MSKKENKKKGTDPDVRPSRGQESNENWDDSNDQSTSANRPDADRTDEDTKISGNENDHSKDSETEKFPGDEGKDRGGNQTGPGLG